MATSIYRTPAGERAVLEHYDAVLGRWPVPYESLYVETRHGRTHVIASGDPAAPPLVLMHGLSVNATMWRRVVDQFCKAHRVYAFDMVGQPGRSAMNTPHERFAGYLEWFADTIDALKIEQTKLVGISLGGWTVLRYTISHPSRVNRVSALAPAGLVPPNLPRLLWAALPALINRSRGARTFAERIAAPDKLEEAVAALTLHIQHLHSRTIKPPIFTDAELASLKMPVQLLVSQHDIFFDPVRSLARVRQNIPHAQTELIPKASHLLPLSQQDVVMPKIMAFLNS